MFERTILITGGAGFIGSNFINYFTDKYPQTLAINLDKLTYSGDLKNLSTAENRQNYRFEHGDICDTKFLNSLFEKYKIDGVIHFAAESHVDNSIDSPIEFMQTNIMGTFNLLECVRKNIDVEEVPNFRFHHVSTDEVYGSLSLEENAFTEKSRYAPNSPYSASKASSDLIVRAYFKTFKLNCVTTNCSNNFGPRQHTEKLIPTIIGKAINNQSIPIYGDGKNIRDWLYVDDHCRFIDLVYHEGTLGETYLIGGSNEIANIDLAHTICSILDDLLPRGDKRPYSDQISFVKDRPGHDFRYAIDASKIEKEFKQKISPTPFESAIKSTIEWYLEFGNLT